MTPNLQRTNETPETFLFHQIFPSFPSGTLSPSDFLVRLDIIACLCAHKKISLEEEFYNMRKQFITEIGFEANLYSEVFDYYSNYRSGFIIMSHGDTINSPMRIMKTLIPIICLSILANKNDNELDLPEIEAEISRILSRHFRDIARIKYRVHEIVDQYFEGSKELSDITFEYLSSNAIDINELKDSLIEAIDCKPNERVPRFSKETRPQNIPGISIKMNTPAISFDVTNLYVMKLACVLELALRDKQKLQSTSREDLIARNWDKVFTGIQLTDERQGEYENVISNNDYLHSLNLLFTYPLDKIRSEKIIRSIIVIRCVHQVIATMPYKSAAINIAAEALELFDSNFKMMSVGKEEADITDYTNKYITYSGFISEHITALLKKNALLIQEQFTETVQAFSNRIARTTDNVEKLGQELGNLKTQLTQSKASAIIELIQKLASPEYGYVLGRIFRYSQSIETPTSDQINYLAKDILRILSLFAVEPIEAENVGTIATESEMDLGQYDLLQHQLLGKKDFITNEIVFPGWRVSGDLVTFPVLNGDKGAEKTDE